MTPHTAQSEWSLFSLEQLPEGDDNDLRDTADAREVPASAATNNASSVASTASPQPALTQLPILPNVDSTGDSFIHPDSPVDVSTCGSQRDEDQTIPGFETPEITPAQPSPSGPDLPTTTSNVPMDARETTWMKSKQTLKYFREVYKLGKLSDLIFHWHQLEEALGFPETVSCDCASCEKFS